MPFLERIKASLAHPLTRGLDVDDPQTTQLRRQIIREKPFLRLIYEEWYESIRAAIPPGPGRVLELGSGAGFLPELLPDLITSEVFPCPGIHVVMDGRHLPLENGSLRAIVMTDVLHHIPQPRRFFTEAARCVRPGGVVAMIEPWVTPFSRLIYTRFHSEPFVPDASQWEIPSSGPLSGANGAMPWILFHRDRALFQSQFPQWQLAQIRPFMPLRYLVSGGVSMRSLMPGWSFPLWRCAEWLLRPWMNQLAMFAQIVLVRRERG